MVGLIDIAPRTEKVEVDGFTLDVRGISAAGVAHILARFPDIRKMMTGYEIEADRLFEMGGEAVAAIIAAGCGYPGNADAEAKAAELSVDAQAEILEAVLRLTLPKGIGPFVARLNALGAGLGGSAKAQDTKSPKP